MKHAFLAIIIICYGSIAMSQCEFEIITPIFSQELGQYEIIVSDLQQFELGVNQELCGLNLHFEHTSLTNLRISLISPDGDRVYLVGPATTAPIISDFTDWDVQFVPCGSPAAPDVGIPDQWSNTSNWNSIETYDGSYYPSGGCLEDFDSGSANGIWTIEIEDLGQLNEGTLHSVELIFCDPSGLACQICDAQILEFNSDQMLYCEGTNVTIEPSELIIHNEAEASLPVLIIVQNGQIIEITQGPLQIETLTQGIYQLYGAVILNTSDYSGITSLTDLEALLVGGAECGDLSTESIDLNILEVLNTEIITEILCRDEPFVWNDEIFVAPLDTILYTFDQTGACNTSTEISLTLQESGLQISQSFEVVECGEEIVLTATVIDPNVSYLWTTLDGSIVTGSSTPFVIVNQPGTYYLFGEGDCIPSDSITLNPAGNFDQVSLSITADDCSSTSGTLNITTDLTLSSYYWLGPDIEGSTEASPSISQDGEYGLVVFSDDFVCDSIIVYQSYLAIDQTVQGLIKANDLDCMVRAAQLFIDTGEAFVLDSKWYNPSGFLIGNGLSISVTQGGVYTVDVSYLNGCIETFTIEVFDSKQVYDLTVDLILLDCNTQQGFASLNTNGTVESVVWTGPFGYYSEDITAELNSFGTYRAIVQYADGCRQVFYFEADYNENTSPVVELGSDPIDCNNECGILYVISGHDPSYIYNWAGPAGFQSSLFNPKVFNSGNYFVTVTDSDGCESIYFHFVEYDAEGISFTIQAEELTCVNQSTDLMIAANFNRIESFTWSGPEIDATNESEQIPVVSTPGLYTISGIGTNGCDFEQSVEVMIDNSPATVTNDQENFNIVCQGGSTTMEVIADQPITGYVWNVPFEFGPTLTTADPGLYSVTVTNANFCTTVANYTVTQNDLISIDQLETVVQLTCDQPTSTQSLMVNSLDSSLELIIQEITAVALDGTELNGIQNTDTEGEITFEQEGEYTLTVSLTNGCLITEVITVTESFDAIEPEVNIPVLNCNNLDGLDVILNNASQYLTIEWNDTDVILGSDATYILTDFDVPLNLYVEDINGCESNIEIELITDTIPPVFSLAYEGSTDCEIIAGTLTASIEGDVTYNWTTLDGQLLTDPTERTVLVDGNGVYMCEVTSIENGCSETSSLNVDDQDSFGVIDLITLDPTCDNNALVIVDVNLDNQTVLGEEFNLYIDNQEVTLLPVSLENNGSSVITIENLQGCRVDTTVNVDLIPKYNILVESFHTVKEGESVEIVIDFDSAQDISGFEVEWSGDPHTTGFMTAEYAPLETSIYSVTVTDSYGCSQIQEFTIEVTVSTVVFVPNVFRIGNTGQDGTLTISAPEGEMMEIEVYDRWGNLMYKEQNDGSQISWNGTLDGNTVEQGVYIVCLNVIFRDGEQMRQISDVTIIR